MDLPVSDFDEHGLLVKQNVAAFYLVAGIAPACALKQGQALGIEMPGREGLDDIIVAAGLITF